MITDYETVMFSFKDKALQGMDELSKQELAEIMGVLMWFMELMKEFRMELPQDAIERIGTVKRFMEMNGQYPRLNQ